MEPRLNRADIIILAAGHNPSIVSPQWLKDNSLIAEAPTHFVHTPDFSVFESDSFSLIVDHQRLQIVAKKQSESSIGSLAAVAGKYVSLLKHIPYKALGLNLVWSIETNGNTRLPDVTLKLNNSDPALAFTGHKVAFGGIIYAQKESYVLKLTIERQGEKCLVHNFNYHHELASVSIDNIVGLAHSFVARFKDSAAIINALYPDKNSK
jgi:hypothetical protein